MYEDKVLTNQLPFTKSYRHKKRLHNLDFNKTEQHNPHHLVITIYQNNKEFWHLFVNLRECFLKLIQCTFIKQICLVNKKPQLNPFQT